MKILIAGSNGQVGFELCKRAKQTTHDIVCFDRSTLDVSSESVIRNILLTEMPDIVINATAYTAVDKAEQEPELAFNINANAPKHMAKICHEIGAALIHISTDYVFSGTQEHPYGEADAVGPSGIYGSSKLEGEREVQKACPRHIILRTAWVFGEQGNNFVKTMLRVAQSRDELGVVSDQFGAPTSAAGIVDALLEIVNHISQREIRWGVYHYCGSPYTTWHGFAEHIFHLAHDRNLLPHKVHVKAITSEQYPTPAKRPAYSKLDCSKIKEEFGIEPDDWQKQLCLLLDTLSSKK